MNVSRTSLATLRMVLDRWLDQSATIADLQRRIDTQCNPELVQDLRNTISFLKQQLGASEREGLRSKSELETLLNVGSFKDKRIKRLEEEVRALANDQSASAAHAREYIAQSEILQCRKENAALKKETDNLEGKLLRAQRRVCCEQWTTSERYKLERKYDTELRQKQNELDQQAEVIAKLKATSATRTPESQPDTEHIVNSTLKQWTDDADERLNVVAILFVAGLQQFGANLAALNIDTKQFEACLAWARVIFSDWNLMTATEGTGPSSLIDGNDSITRNAGTAEETMRNAGIVSKQSGSESVDIPSSIAGNQGVSLPVASSKLKRRSAPSSGNVADLERITSYGAVTKLRLPRQSTISCTALDRLSLDL